MTTTSSPRESSRLRAALGRRQMSMIAIGGVIGAGLFVGSGEVIHSTGPGVIIAYVVAGLVVVLVMRMLAEMAVAKPETGSFSSYATRELGPWAGLSVGWLYAYQWCVTVGFEAAAGAAIIHRVWPAVPAWGAALVFMVVLTGTNLARVNAFGEFEFWFATIKVIAIVAFILLGLVAIAGALPGMPAPGGSNLFGHGGFLPHGPSAVLFAMLTVVFSYFGTEVVTVAAGEAADPVNAVRRGMRSVVWRILVFYIGSVAIVVTLLPAGSASIAKSPFVAVLDQLNVPLASHIMDVVVVTAVLSCLNSGIYSSSRMLYALAERREAPALLRRTSTRGVPVFAVFGASLGGFVTVVADYFLPNGAVFNFLLDSSGAVAVIVYLCISITQLRGRARVAREDPAALTVRMWAYPYLTWLVILALVAIMVGMAIAPDSRNELLLTSVVTVVVVIAGLINQQRKVVTDAAAPKPVSGT